MLMHEAAIIPPCPELVPAQTASCLVRLSVCPSHRYTHTHVPQKAGIEPDVVIELDRPDEMVTEWCLGRYHDASTVRACLPSVRACVRACASSFLAGLSCVS